MKTGVSSTSAKMTAMKRLLCLAFLLCLSTHAWAGDASGWWVSDTGSKLQIWSSPQEVVLTFDQGRDSFQLAGTWKLYSDVFTYSDGRDTFTCSFKRPNLIKVKSSFGHSVTWKRIVGVKVPSIEGRWNSTTGARITVKASGKGPISVTVANQGRSPMKGKGRWTSYPYNFEYQVPNFAGKLKGSVLPGGQIFIAYTRPTVWTRSGQKRP